MQMMNIDYELIHKSHAILFIFEKKKFKIFRNELDENKKRADILLSISKFEEHNS